MPALAKQAPRGSLIDFFGGGTDLGIPRRFAPMRTLGTGGAIIHGGYIQSPEKDSTLVGVDKFRTFSEILVNSPIAGASVRLFLNLVGAVDVKLEPADDSAQAEELAEFAWSVLNDMRTPLSRVRRRAAGYRTNGFSTAEWTAKRREDGQFGFLDVEARAQVTIERFSTDEHQNLLGVIQRNPQTNFETPLPIGKLLYLVYDETADSPDGLGLLRHAVGPARRVMRYEQLEGWGFETDLRGTPVGRAPLRRMKQLVRANRLSDEDFAALRAPMDDFIENHIANPARGLVLDSATYETNDGTDKPSNQREWDVELMKAGSTMAPDVNRAIERDERRIARLFGTEALLLGSDGKGSLALSEDKTDTLRLIVDSTNSDLNEAMTAQLLVPLWRLNGFPMDLVPTMKTDKVSMRTILEITGAMKDLSDSGAPVAPQDEAVGEVYDRIGLTRPSAEKLAEGVGEDPTSDTDTEPGDRDDDDDEEETVEREELET